LDSWTKANSIRLILVGLVVVALLSSGVFALSWTYPNDQASMFYAALNGEQYPNGGWVPLGNSSSGFFGPYVVSVGPNSTVQYTLEFRPGLSKGTLSYVTSPIRNSYLWSPISWNPPSPTTPSTRMYVIFTYGFPQGTCACSPTRYSAAWFTGPQGNLSQSVQTVQYGGIGFAN
jgi:hypothetical protein